MKYIQMNDYVTRFDGIMQSVRQEYLINEQPYIITDKHIIDNLQYDRRMFRIL
jgi:hypothetical protein